MQISTFGRGHLDWNWDDVDLDDGLPEGASIVFNVITNDPPPTLRDEPSNDDYEDMQWAHGSVALIPTTGIGLSALAALPPKARKRVLEEQRTTIELDRVDAKFYAFADGSVDVDLDDAIDSLCVELHDSDLAEIVPDTTVELSFANDRRGPR